MCRTERLGALVDGAKSFATGMPEKLLATLGLVVFSMPQEMPSRTLVEMLVGRLVHRMQLRRPTMSALARVWKYMRRWGRNRELPAEVGRT